MSKEYQDGLSMDRSFYMEKGKQSSFQLSARIIQFITIILGGWVFVSVLRECLNLSLNMLLIYPAILIISGAFIALSLYPALDLVKLFFSLLFYGLFFFSRLDKIKNGFYILENLILDRLADYYSYESLQFKADYIYETADTTLLLIMIIIPVIALITIAIIRNRLLHITCIIFCLPVAICFLVGLIPSEKYLISYVAMMLYLVRSGVSFRSNADKEQFNLIHEINCRAAVWLSVIGIALIFVLKLFVTEENYGKLSGIKEAKSEVQSVLLNTSMDDIVNKFKKLSLFGDSISAGGLYGGKLARDGNVKYTNSEQLTVTAPQESFKEGMYLKGYVGSVYTGSSWKGHSKEDKKSYEELRSELEVVGFPPLNQTCYLLKRLMTDPTLIDNSDSSISLILSSNLSFDKGDCLVEYKDANKKYMYAPYFTDYGQMGEIKQEQDLYAAPEKKQGQYQFSYYYGFRDFMSYLTFVNIPDDIYLHYEKLYRDYVYRVYTKMPEKRLDKLKLDFSKTTLPGAGTMEKIQYVQKYLQENTSYSLNPGRLPDGEDFVEYFLYQNKKGYCAHYASAAVLMLRSMGIPARYVEGYFVAPEPNAKVLPGAKKKITKYTGKGVSQYDTDVARVSVKDFNAHAWAEIYLDGYGWLPFDFTPGAAISSMIERSMAAGDKENQKPTKATDTPTPAMKESNKDKKDIDQQTSSTSVQNEKEYATLDIVFLAAFILLAVSAVVLFLIYKCGKRRSIKNSRNRNMRALYLYREMETLMSIAKFLPGRKSCIEDSEEHIRQHLTGIDTDIYDTFLEAARKARFGNGSISEDELSMVETFHHVMYKELYEQMNIAGKIFYKIALLMEI